MRSRLRTLYLLTEQGAASVLFGSMFLTTVYVLSSAFNITANDSWELSEPTALHFRGAIHLRNPFRAILEWEERI
jgi:hypothetical protein